MKFYDSKKCFGKGWDFSSHSRISGFRFLWDNSKMMLRCILNMFGTFHDSNSYPVLPMLWVFFMFYELFLLPFVRWWRYVLLLLMTNAVLEVNNWASLQMCVCTCACVCVCLHSWGIAYITDGSYTWRTLFHSINYYTEVLHLKRFLYINQTLMCCEIQCLCSLLSQSSFNWWQLHMHSLCVCVAYWVHLPVCVTQLH